jgi:hypothetical protein
MVQQVYWEQHALVKLWAMRGTLHLRPSAELEVWLAALGTFTTHGNRGNADIDRLLTPLGAPSTAAS